MNKTLVAFFSASGNTKRVAEKLAAAIATRLSFLIVTRRSSTSLLVKLSMIIFNISF